LISAASAEPGTVGGYEITMAKQLPNIAEEMNAERTPPPLEERVAFALGRLIREILPPGEQHDLVNSLTRGPQIERSFDAVQYFASEAIQALPCGQWENVFSLLDQGGTNLEDFSQAV